MEGNAAAPVLYMALELSNRTWRLAFGDGARRRQVSVPAADLAALAGAVAKAKERFEMPASARVVSCYEAGRDGFWLPPAPDQYWHGDIVQIVHYYAIDVRTSVA
jgi:transposase